MTCWQRIKRTWRNFWRAYHHVIVRPAWVRIDPMTLLTIIGLLGTAWNMGVATRLRGDADTAVQQLLDAPGQFRSQLDQQLADGQIDPFTYNARMEQVDRLAGVLAQYAALYDQRGDQIFELQMLNGIRDAALSLSPGEAAGKSLSGISSMQAGKGIDALITLQSTVEGVEGGYADMYRSWKQSPFADLNQQLQTQIDAIMGADLEPFFAARMRGKVNEMKNIYLDLLRQYPDDSGEAARQYTAVLNQRAERYADVLMLAGEGRHWASVDEFRDWLDDLVQEAVLAEGPEADLLADDSWEDEPDAPPADVDIPDDAFGDDTAVHATMLPDITIMGGNVPGDESVELFHYGTWFDWDHDSNLIPICEPFTPSGYRMTDASSHSFFAGGPTLICAYEPVGVPGSVRLALSVFRNVAGAQSQWGLLNVKPPSSCLSDPIALHETDRKVVHCLVQDLGDPEMFETRLYVRYRNTIVTVTEQLDPGQPSQINALALWAQGLVDERAALH